MKISLKYQKITCFIALFFGLLYIGVLLLFSNSTSSYIIITKIILSLLFTTFVFQGFGIFKYGLVVFVGILLSTISERDPSLRMQAIGITIVLVSCAASFGKMLRTQYVEQRKLTDCK